MINKYLLEFELRYFRILDDKDSEDFVQHSGKYEMVRALESVNGMMLALSLSNKFYLQMNFNYMLYLGNQFLEGEKRWPISKKG